MDRERRVAEILGEWHRARERGKAPDPEVVIRAHPELAADLRAGFDVARALDEMQPDWGPLREWAPEEVGPYRILRELGSGGMGTVFMAEVVGRAPGLPAGERVAIKLLRPGLLARPGFFKRFLREATAGRQVRHENVVRTLDADALEVEGRSVHFIVMEYVEGRTLGDLVGELGMVPEALVREIALQLARGLCAIHTEGIVHRDLKPENAIITSDHAVRIMDLGVARLVEDSVSLTREGQFAGSLPYAAPEQFRGHEVGPAADLYSLGVLLFELLTGENPFRRGEAAAVMRAHLEGAPPRAEELNTDVSAFLSEVVATLLEKQPSARFTGAQRLVEVLTAGERSPWWSERERVRKKELARLPRVPVRRETRLYGREDDLALLRETWMKAAGGEGVCLLVNGEAGIGKSRLVDAFLSELDGEAAHVLYGSYPPSGGLGGLSDAILGRLGAEGLAEALRPYLTVTPDLVTAFAALVKREPVPEGAPEISGDALHAVFCHLLRGLAREKPLLWVVEDLHFAEPDSRALLLSMARAVEGHRVLLLLTTRPGVPQEELAHLSRLDHFRKTALSRLSAREVVLLLQDSLRSEVLADKLGARIALKSDGVPFFVFEMVRGLLEGQFITQLPDGSYVETREIERIEVPSAVRDLIEARLRGLTKEERALLDVGSIHGFGFDPDLVARTLGRPRVAVLQDLADLDRRSGVVRSVGAAYRFDHHQIQEVVYEDFPPGLRGEYHTLLARALADREGVEPEKPHGAAGETAHQLASHHLRGREPREALPFLEPALG
ncbi:MAG: serine/threonine-protein kinase, partial [Planctomycetota bacterium]